MSLYRMSLFVLLAVLSCPTGPSFETVASSMLPTTAHAAEAAGFVRYAPEGKEFWVQIPSDWDRDESPFLRAHKEYGVRLRAPGLKDLGYVIIDIAYYGAAHRTPSFLASLQLALALLFAIAALAVPGTLGTPAALEETLRRLLGPGLLPAARFVGLVDTYRSPLFIALLALLGLNVTARF